MTDKNSTNDSAADSTDTNDPPNVNLNADGVPVFDRFEYGAVFEMASVSPQHQITTTSGYDRDGVYHLEAKPADATTIARALQAAVVECLDAKIERAKADGTMDDGQAQEFRGLISGLFPGRTLTDMDVGEALQNATTKSPLDSAFTVQADLASLTTDMDVEIPLRTVDKPFRGRIIAGPVINKEVTKDENSEQITVTIENTNDTNANWRFHVRRDDTGLWGDSIRIQRDVQTNDDFPNDLTDIYTVLWVSIEETDRQ